MSYSAVEREIFHLGLCLEELKERLEPRVRHQPPSKRLDQPQSPPAPSPSPAARCLHPEVSWWGGKADGVGMGSCFLTSPLCCALQSPMVMDGPQGTAGDTEVVTEELPQPLWRKQQQVEEDFGDLLEQ